MRAVLCCIALTLAVPSVATAAKRKNGERQAALFVIAKDPAAAEMIGVIHAVLRDAAGAAPQLDVVSGKALRKRLRADPGAAIELCGADLPCIAKLARKARALEAIYVRVGGAAGAWEAQVVVVDAKKGKIARRSVIALAGKDDARLALLGSFESIFGVKGFGQLEAPGVEADVSVDGAVIGKGPGPFQLSPGKHTVTVAGVTTDVVIEPGRKLKLQASGGATAAYDPPIPSTDAAEPEAGPEDEPAPDEPSLVPLDGTAVELAELPLEAVPEVERVAADEPAREPEAPGEPLRWMRWGGLGAAALGVVAFGVGAAFGIERRGMEQEAKSGTQKNAVRVMDESKGTALKANIFMIGGGVLAAAGAALFAVDLANTPQVSVSVSEGGAGATLSLGF